MSLERVEVNDAVLNALSEAKIKSYNFEIDKDAVMPFILNELKEGYEELNSEEVKKARNDYFEVPGVTEEDYGEFVFKTDNDIFLMVGIRHFGGNKELPFVHMLSSQINPSLEDWREWYSEVKELFSKFKPLHICFGSHDRKDVDFVGSVTMLTEASTYRNLPLWEGEDKLTLSQETDMSLYDFYVEGYANFHKNFPDLKQKVSTLDKGTLEDSMKEGLLFSTRLNGELVGLIAAVSSDFLGMDGLYFNEIFLLEKVKGQGLGKILQKKFVLEVTKGHEIVWGTIDEFNIPSFKTAQANGRRPVHYECFLKVG